MPGRRPLILKAAQKVNSKAASAMMQLSKGIPTSPYLNNYLLTPFRTDTWTLLHALNALIQPGAAQPWLRPAFMQSLTLIPLRKDGVRATMELVFMVHPSSTGQPGESKEPQKQGSSITHEAVAVATKLLSTVPAGMPAKDWFQGISGQLFSLLDGEAGPDLSRTAAQIIGFGILGRREFGAPGTPRNETMLDYMSNSSNREPWMGYICTAHHF